MGGLIHSASHENLKVQPASSSDQMSGAISLISSSNVNDWVLPYTFFTCNFMISYKKGIILSFTGAVTSR